MPKNRKVSKEEFDAAMEHFVDVKNRTREINNLSDIRVNKIHYFDDSLPSEELEEKFGERFTCRSLSKEFSSGEISAQGVTKEDGMKQILNHFNRPLEETIAIDNDYNDVEMLRYASYSTALDHAPKEVEKYADSITKDINNDGFYHALKYVELI